MDDRLRTAAAQLEEKKRRLEELKRMTSRLPGTGVTLVRTVSSSTVTDPAAPAASSRDADSGTLLLRSTSTGAMPLSRALDEASAIPATTRTGTRVKAALQAVSSVSETMYTPEEDGVDASLEAQSSTSQAQLAAFMLRAGRLVDRALCQTDYLDLDPVYARAEGGRIVACAPSASHAELVAASYVTPATDAVLQSGQVCVWHDRLHTQQCDLLAGAPITAMQWGDACNTSPSILFAGISAGGVLAWDIRLPQTRPAMESSVVADAHVSAIVALLGAHTSAAFEGAASLLSLCRDGRLCTWDPRKITAPATSVLMANSAHHWHGAEATAACMGSAQDGCIAVGYAHGKVDMTAGYGRQSETSLTTCMHSCDVTSVSVHAQSSSARGAAVSVCADGRACLWAYQTGAASTLTELSSPRGAVCTMARWAPTRAAAVVTCDDAGGIYWYDAAADLLAPTAAIQLPGDVVACSMEWAVHHDAALTIGDSRGHLRRIHAADASSLLGAHTPPGVDTLTAQLTAWRTIASEAKLAMQ